MLLSFPYMHPELASLELAQTMFFLDPGLGQTDAKNSYRPKTLPLDGKTAQALIGDCIRFGEQFKDPGEMAYFGALTTEDFYEGSSMSIQAQLLRQFNDGQESRDDRVKNEALSRSQFVLLLAWFFEEKCIELNAIESGVKRSWHSMDQTLGVDDADRIDQRVLDLSNRESHTGGVSDEQSISLPWQRVIEALPAFIPQDTVLFCTAPHIISVWDDMDIVFSAVDSADLPQEASVATLPAWQFAGRKRVPDEFPMSANEITVAIIR